MKKYIALLLALVLTLALLTSCELMAPGPTERPSIGLPGEPAGPGGCAGQPDGGTLRRTGHHQLTGGEQGQRQREGQQQSNVLFHSVPSVQCGPLSPSHSTAAPLPSRATAITTAGSLDLRRYR